MNFDPRELTPDWDHTVTLRGVEVPLRAPERVDAADVDPTGAAEGIVHAPRRLWRRLRRAIFGATPSAELRSACRRLVAPEFFALIDRLTVDELIAVSQVYMACQAAHFHAIGEAAAQRLGAGAAAPASSTRRRAADHTPAQRITLTHGGVPDALRSAVEDARRGKQG